MTVTYKEIPEEKTVELTVSGKVTKEDFNRISTQFEAFIDQHGEIKLIEIISDFKGFDPSVVWDGLKFDMKHIKNISHCAVVSDIGWMTPLAKTAGALVSTKLRTFDMNQVDEAKNWLKAA